MQSKHLGISSTLLAISLLAGNGYFAKGLLSDAVTITMVRSVIAALAIILFVKYNRGQITLKVKTDYYLVSVMGVLLGVHWVGFFYSMQISTVTLGMTALYTYPLMTLLLESTFLSKKVPVSEWLVAPVLVLGVWMMGSATSQSGENNALGIAVGLLSALCFAIRNLLQQQYLKRYPPHHTIYYQVIVVSLLALPGSLYLADLSMLKTAAASDWYKWLLLGVFFTALPHSLVATGIRHIGAKSVAVIGCMQPAIASVIAYVLLGEIATTQVIVGACIVTGAACYEISKK